MEEGWGSWYPQQRFNWRLHSYFQTSLDKCGSSSPLLGSDIGFASRNGALPMKPCIGYPYTALPCIGQSCYSFRSGFIPKVDVNGGIDATAVVNSQIADASHKKFLVFDQSGDHTTLIFSCDMEAQAPLEASNEFWNPKMKGPLNLKNSILEKKIEADSHPKSILPQELADDNGPGFNSDMNEDSEELNALLYSEDDSDSREEDEVNSTGHSPAQNRDDRPVGLTEEVASTDGSPRKRRATDACLDDHSSGQTVSSRRARREDDAESKCADYIPPSDSCSRRERIRETVNILQNIIPGGRSDDPLLVLDEAIEYLKCLKKKAEALRASAQPL